LLTVLLPCIMSAQDKYKEYAKANKVFTYQGGIGLSRHFEVIEYDYGSNFDLRREVESGEGIAIHSNFIYRGIGAHFEADFFAEVPTGVKRFKKFDIGMILKAGGLDLSFGSSYSNYFIYEKLTTYNSGSYYYSDTETEYRNVLEKAKGFFVGIGISMGAFRLSSKYTRHKMTSYLFEGTKLNGLTVSLGVDI